MHFGKLLAHLQPIKKKYSPLEKTGVQKQDEERIEGEKGTLDDLGKLLADLVHGVTNVSGDKDIFANFSLTLDKL